LESIMQGGGEVGTALVTLARLGARVKYLGKLADDEFGHFLLEDFKKEGVDTSNVIVEKGNSLFAFILIEKKSGKRTIVYTDKNVPGLRPEEITFDQIKKAKILLINQSLPDIKAALLAAERMNKIGGKVVLDASWITSWTKRLINLSEIIIGDEDFAFKFTGEKDYFKAAQEIFSLKKDGIVAITAGTKGCFCISREGKFHTPAFKVKAKDTTGAGDVFHGAFIYGILQEWDLPYIVKFASAVAALKCRSLGGRAGIPTLSEVKNFLSGGSNGRRMEIAED